MIDIHVVMPNLPVRLNVVEAALKTAKSVRLLKIIILCSPKYISKVLLYAVVCNCTFPRVASNNQ